MNDPTDDLEDARLSERMRRWGVSERRRGGSDEPMLPIPPELGDRLLAVQREEPGVRGVSRTNSRRFAILVMAASIAVALGVFWWSQSRAPARQAEFATALLSPQPDALRGGVDRFKSGERVFVLCAVDEPALGCLAMLDSAGNFDLVLDETGQAPLRPLTRSRNAAWTIELDDGTGREAIVILASTTLKSPQEFAACVRPTQAALQAASASEFEDALALVSAGLRARSDISVQILVFDHLPR